jgi:hypothetical protein
MWKSPHFQAASALNKVSFTPFRQFHRGPVLVETLKTEFARVRKREPIVREFLARLRITAETHKEPLECSIDCPHRHLKRMNWSRGQPRNLGAERCDLRSLRQVGDVAARTMPVATLFQRKVVNEPTRTCRLREKKAPVRSSGPIDRDSLSVSALGLSYQWARFSRISPGSSYGYDAGGTLFGPPVSA